MEQRQSPHPRWDEEVGERLVAGDEAALRELSDEFSPLRLAGADRPPRSARLVLVGPGGGDWTISPAVQEAPTRPPDATVTMGALEFCYLLGNRRDRDSVPDRVEGDPVVAATLLRAAITLGCD